MVGVYTVIRKLFLVLLRKLEMTTVEFLDLELSVKGFTFQNQHEAGRIS